MNEAKPLKYLGWMNDWKHPVDERYKQIEDCRKLGHKTIDESNGRGYNKTTCPTCGYYYEVDSSG